MRQVNDLNSISGGLFPYWPMLTFHPSVAELADRVIDSYTSSGNK